MFINRLVFLRFDKMAILQLRSKRKATGGRYKRVLVKRMGRQGRLPVFTKLAAYKRKQERTIGGNVKEKLLSADKVNVYDSATKAYVVLAIKNIVENPANRHYVRRNILTKGCIVETEKGKAQITSRPGQSAVVNAILIK